MSGLGLYSGEQGGRSFTLVIGACRQIAPVAAKRLFRCRTGRGLPRRCAPHSGATFWACQAAGGPADGPIRCQRIRQQHSRSLAVAILTRPRFLARREEVGGPRIPNFGPLSFSGHRALEQAPTRRATPVGPSAAPAAWRYCPQASGLILRSLGLLKQAYPAHYWDVVRGFLREGVVQHIGGIQTVLPQLYDDIIAQPNYAEDPSEVFWSISCE